MNQETEETMITKSDVINVVNFIGEQAKTVKSNGNDVAPILFLLKGNTLTIAPPMDIKDKDEINGVVKSLIDRYNPDAVAIMSEAWMIKDGDINKPPSANPNRIECIMVQASSPRWDIAKFIPFTHDANRIVFGQEVTIDDAECRFFFGVWGDKIIYH